METIKSGLPVTVYYTRQGDRMIFDKVVIQKTTTTTSTNSCSVEFNRPQGIGLGLQIELQIGRFRAIPYIRGGRILAEEEPKVKRQRVVFRHPTFAVLPTPGRRHQGQSESARGYGCS